MVRYTEASVALDHIIFNLVKTGVEVPVGVWQAQEIFMDEIMLVKRNIAFTVPLKSGCTPCLLKTGADLPWVEEHFKERVSGVPTNPGEAYKIWPYNTFGSDNDPYMQGKEFSHTYQERIWPREANENVQQQNQGIRYNLGDLQDVINLLAEQPLTRQAYLPIWFPEDTGAVQKQRVPCTLGYYFYMVEETLNMAYTIRSCDAFRHFRNDMYLTMRLLQYVSDILKVKIGELYFTIFNLHIFKNDLYALTKKERKLNNGYFKEEN